MMQDVNVSLPREVVEALVSDHKSKIAEALRAGRYDEVAQLAGTAGRLTGALETGSRPSIPTIPEQLKALDRRTLQTKLEAMKAKAQPAPRLVKAEKNLARVRRHRKHRPIGHGLPALPQGADPAAYFTVEEAAKLADISRASVARWARKAGIGYAVPGWRGQNKMLVDPAGLDAVLRGSIGQKARVYQERAAKAQPKAMAATR